MKEDEAEAGDTQRQTTEGGRVCERERKRRERESRMRGNRRERERREGTKRTERKRNEKNGGPRKKGENGAEGKEETDRQTEEKLRLASREGHLKERRSIDERLFPMLTCSSSSLFACAWLVDSTMTTN